MSIFDTRSASVYLTDKTDVAFRPFGLDLFDKLVRACNGVREQLGKEQRALTAPNELALLQAQIPEDTAVVRLLANINVLTTPEMVWKLSRLSSDEDSRLDFLEKALVDRKANDRERLRKELSARAGRVKRLAEHMRTIESSLSPASLDAVFALRDAGQRKLDEARRLRNAAFPSDMLPGTGTQLWSSLWESARKFSEEIAYPEAPFPVLDDGARCVLCQQEFDDAVSSQDITRDDCRAVKSAMTKCSRWLRGHDEAPAARTLVPVPLEIRADIDKLAASLAAIRKRRKL